MSKQRREVKNLEKVLDSASDDEDVQDEGSMDEDSTEEVRGNGAVIPDKNPRVTKKTNSELKDSLDKNKGSDESLSEEEVRERESDNDSDSLPLSKGKKRPRTTPNKKAKGGRSNKEVSEEEVEGESKASREKLQKTLPKCTVKMDRSKQKATGKDQSSEEDESERKEDEGNSDDGGSVPQPRQKKRKIAQKEPRKSTKAEDSDESMKEDDEGTDEEGQQNIKKSAKGKGSKPTRRSKMKTSKEEESENEENYVQSDSGSDGSSKNLRSDSQSESSEDDYKPGRNTASQPRKGAGRARGRGAWRGRARGRGRGRGGARRYEPSDDEDDVKASTSFQRTPRGRSRRQRHSDSEEEKSLCGSGMSSSNSRPAGTAELLCELCRVFYTQGWVTGTGGGISIKDGKIIYVAPSGVQKERLEPEDLFQLNLKGEIVTPPRDTSLKCSQCTPLFMLAYKLRNAGAVIHSHSKHAVLATLISKGKEFTTTHLEMIKGVRDASTGKALRYDDRLVVPIIDNTPFEADLAESMEQALVQYPACNAVLVRRHGVYVWGDTWQAAKSMAESYNYLFEVAVDMHRLKLDYTAPPSIPAEVEANGK